MKEKNCLEPNVSENVTLLLNDKVQQLLDDFAIVFDVRITYFDPNGEWIRRGNAMRNCEYCRKIHKDSEKLKLCKQMDYEQQKIALETNNIVVYRCHAGLYEAISPIKKNDKLLGYLMIGQFRCLSADNDTLIDQELMSEYESLPIFTEEKMYGMLGLFKTLIEYIVLRELAALKHEKLYFDIEQYIENNLHNEDLRISNMAKKLGKSVSSISQFLRQNGHAGFKELLIEKRLDKAEELWRENPQLTISETAYNTGFKDPFYFSRIFHQRRGIPPGKFRDTLYTSLKNDN